MGPVPHPPANGTRVAIVDPLPAFRTGLAQALRRVGFQPEQPQDLPSWIDANGPRAAVVTLGEPEDLDLISHLKNGRDFNLLILCDQPPEGYLRKLIRLGCYSLVDRSASTDLIAQALKMTVERYGVAPVEVARSLTKLVPTTDCHDISECEVVLLQDMATGARIAELAADRNYSEREMYRVLKRLYYRMQVSNRSQALVTAVRNGLI